MIQAVAAAGRMQRAVAEEKRDALSKLSEWLKASMNLYKPRLPEKVMVVTMPPPHIPLTSINSRTFDEQLQIPVGVAVQIEKIFFGDKAPTQKYDVRVSITAPGKYKEYHQVLIVWPASVTNKNDTLTIVTSNYLEEKEN